MNYKKGEVWEVNLNPTKGVEQAGRIPVVTVSGNLLNTCYIVVDVCSLTTKIKNYKVDVVLSPNSENGLQQDSEVLIMHLCSISLDRLETKLGVIN